MKKQAKTKIKAKQPKVPKTAPNTTSAQAKERKAIANRMANQSTDSNNF